MKLNFRFNEFSAHVATLVSGSVVAQIIGLLMSFVLARIYSPADFGTLEQYAMVLAILGVITTGKFEFAILLPKEDDKANALRNLAIRICLVVSLIAGSLFFLTSNAWAEFYSNPELSYVFLLVGLGLFCFGLTNTLTYALNRRKDYKSITVSKILFMAVSEPMKLILSFVSVSGVSLVIAAVCGHLMTSTFLSTKVKWIGKLRENKKMQTWVAKEYKEYPQYNLPGSLLNRAAQWAHIALFSAFFGLGAIGLLALCRRIAMMPLSIIGTSFAQVYYKRLTEIKDPKQLKKSYWSNLKYLLFICAGMIGVVWVLPQNTMAFLFGEEWSEAINYLRVLIFWFALNFAVSSLSFVNHRIREQKNLFFLDLFHFLIVILGIVFAWFSKMDEFQSMTVLVICKVIYYLTHIMVTGRLLNKYILSASND